MNAAGLSFKQAVFVVAVLNFLYFFVEFYVARLIGSVALLADSIDFLEDAAVNMLIFIAIGFSMRNRSFIGFALAGLLLVPGVMTLLVAWEKFMAPVAPDATLLSGAAMGALVINILCAFILVRHKEHSGSLSRAAFLSARNDAFANLAIIGAALVTALTLSGWPDLIVGIAIFLVNLDAALEVYSAAIQERNQSKQC